MNQPPTKQRKARALNTMQAKGFALCALGLAMLVVPQFVGHSPLQAAYASALRPAGWFAWAAGVVLVAIHYVTKAKLARSAKAQQPILPMTPDAPAPDDGPATLRQIRDELKKKADAAEAQATQTRQSQTP